MQINSAPSVAPHVKTGRLKALALARASRWPDLPNVPTFAESGWPQYQANGWYGLCAPAKTPRAVIDKLQRESVKVVTSADFRARLAILVADPVGSSSKEFAAYIRNEFEKYGKVIKATGARAE
jgi:tripartite-type tricarboxylate transporter receptor subunit TctC